MEIVEITPSRIIEYSSISISFLVRSEFELALIQKGLGGFRLQERNVPPYTKDYDFWESPLSWSQNFDITNWGIFLAIEGGKPVGGAAVAWNTNGENMLEGRRDHAVLWDIRVIPELRGRGIGKSLFEHATAWAKSRGCIQMKIETQNNNVNACRFYAGMGAELGDIRRFTYKAEPSLEHEVQLNWNLVL